MLKLVLFAFVWSFAFAAPVQDLETLHDVQDFIAKTEVFNAEVWHRIKEWEQRSDYNLPKISLDDIEAGSTVYFVNGTIARVPDQKYAQEAKNGTTHSASDLDANTARASEQYEKDFRSACGRYLCQGLSCYHQSVIGCKFAWWERKGTHGWRNQYSDTRKVSVAVRCKKGRPCSLYTTNAKTISVSVTFSAGLGGDYNGLIVSMGYSTSYAAQYTISSTVGHTDSNLNGDYFLGFVPIVNNDFGHRHYRVVTDYQYNYKNERDNTNRSAYPPVVSNGSAKGFFALCQGTSGTNCRGI